MKNPLSFLLPKRRTRLMPIPVVFDAVADAITPQANNLITVEVQPVKLAVTASDHNRPDYHAGLAARIVTDFERRANVLESEIRTLDEEYLRDCQERAEHYAASRSAKVDELVGIHLTAKAYGGLVATLTTPAPGGSVPPAVDAVQPKRKPRPGRRETFTVPKGHEAIMGDDGKPTGETRPIPPTHE